MSIIGTIRTKFTWVLLALIALAILAFLLMDSTNGKGSALTGKDFAVGSINGNKIKYSDLQAEMRKLNGLYPNANDEQISNTAWNNLVDQKLFDKKYQDLGISVSNEEISNAIFSENPNMVARQYFGSLFPDGKYNPSEVKKFIEESENKDLIMEQLTTVLGRVLKEEKYSALLRNGVNAPTWVAEDAFLKDQKTVDFDYLMLPYTLVNDSEVSVTDNDLLAFAKENPRRFISKGGTVLEYLRFPKKPSKADSLAVISSLDVLKAQFTTAENPEQFATINTTMNGVNRAINPMVEYQTAETLKMSDVQKNNILNAKTGDVVGPFIAGGVANMVKVLDKKKAKDTVKVQLATIAKSIAPSTATYDAIYNKAKSFAEENQTKEKFDVAAKKIGGLQTTPEISPSVDNVPGIGQNYELVKWLNTAKVGSVKNFNSKGDFIVARVASRVKEGEVDLEKNRITLEAEVKKQKKAELIEKQISEKGGVSQGLATLAGKFNRMSQKATEAKFGGNGTGIGYEPNVMAKAFFLGKKGLVEETITGSRGVYVIDVQDFGSVTADVNIEEFKSRAMNSMLSATTVGGLRTKYEQNGIIKDERYKARR